ncbi:MAG: hypothetical protein FJZ75_00395 [Bacteroidetes bacterium]|nr:hypothetical protein [Bacteroidota bacterium]
MVVAVWVAPKTYHSCIRGYPNYAFLITTDYEYHANLARKHTIRAFVAKQSAAQLPFANGADSFLNEPKLFTTCIYHCSNLQLKH